MTTRALVSLSLSFALAGCVTPSTPGGDPGAPAGPTGPTGNPVVTEGSILHCATSAFVAAADPIPVAYTVTVNLETGLADVRYDRAHEQGDDPFEFAPESWQADVTGSVDGELNLVLDQELSLYATRSPDFASDLWVGTLSSELIGSPDLVCWRDGFAGDFAYEPAQGACFDADGATGFDPLPVAYLRATGDGQCATFAAGTSLNEDFLGYPILRDTDLRGARLAGATLFFADLLEARLEGADLSEFEFGYAHVEGSTDAHTVWPQDLCTLDGDALACVR